MKTRSLKLLMAVILIMQTITFTTVFADASSTPSTVVTSVDFSGSKLYDTTSGVVAGKNDHAVVYGQYGKAADDASLRMYTNGTAGANSQLIRYNPVLTLEENEYVHISFDYLREDYYSGLKMDMSFNDLSNTSSLKYDCVVMDTPTSSSSWYNKIRLFTSNKGGAQTSIDDRYVGSWRKIDMYFGYSTTHCIVFIDGVKKDIDLSNSADWAGGSTYTGMKKLDRVRFTYISDINSAPTPSAVQLDNVLIEKVSTVPETVSFKSHGETLTFDDHMSINKHNDGYGLYATTYLNGTTTTVCNKYNGYGSGPAVYLGMPYANLSVEGGVFGKPSWDKSFHRVVPSDAATVRSTWYDSSINTFDVGEKVHLTFSVANNTTETGFSATTLNSVFTDSSKKNLKLFEMSSDNKIRFLDTATNETWEAKKWYKVDMIFDVKSDGTFADCYLNGKLIRSNCAVNGTKILKDTAQITFSYANGSDYYLDDVSLGRFTESNVPNPANGYSLTDTAETYIDNNEKIIAIESDGSVADYVKLLEEKKNVTVYNENGVINYKGTLNSGSTVKVSNGFGAGTYYNVGYKTDKLAIGDIAFNSEAKTLKSQAELGFTIRENFNETPAPVQTEGTVIIALYNGNELLECKAQPYTGLAEDAAKEVVLQNVESVTGKTVKVFIFNSVTDIKPLVVNKEKAFN